MIIYFIFHGFRNIQMLEQETCRQALINKCKINSLQQQIKWMQHQYQSISLLIAKYKSLIEFHFSKDRPKYTNQVESIDKQIKAKIIQSERQVMNLMKVNELQCEVTSMSFMMMIEWLENEGQMLRQRCQQAQKKIQLHENNKNELDYNLQFKKIDEQLLTINSIESYDSFEKVKEKYKVLVRQYIKKKKDLQFILQKNRDWTKKQSESTSSTIESLRFRKCFQSELEIRSTDPKPFTHLEKTILLYQKKKFTNQKLYQKNKLIKRDLANKRYITQALQRRNQEHIWDRCQLISNDEGQLIFQSNLTSLSINQTINCLPPDFDISKLSIPSRINKNKLSYAQYIAKKSINQVPLTQ